MLHIKAAISVMKYYSSSKAFVSWYEGHPINKL